MRPRPLHIPGLRSLALPYLVLAATVSSAQYWANDFGGTGSDRVADVKTDGNDDVYVVGEFSASMSYQGQAIASLGGTDVFVAKVSATGDLLWMKRAGGGGIDRGYKIAVRNGQIAVTGQFMGMADLFGTQGNIAPGAIDVFVASLEASTGNTNWVATGGSPANVDRSYGLEISPNGSVTMVGEFKGTAQFGSQSLTSVTDPNTGLPSLDVFIAHYSTSGNLLWLQQGAAKYADKAIDVVSDQQNNLYVCGQFSDTVTFDVQHDNIMYNASFILKLDGNGNEQWFRKCGGAALNHVRDMLLASNNELLLCGDLQGTMVYVDAVPDMIVGQEPYAYYLVKVALNGDYVSSSVMPSENPVTARSIDQRADTVAVLGEFNCQFTGLSGFYSGTGLFMAIGNPDLFVSRHRFGDLQLMDAQQFGGQHTNSAGGIVSLMDGSLVFGGGYEHLINFPSDGNCWGERCSNVGFCDVGLYAPNVFESYCGDSLFGAFTGLISPGDLKDGFLARAFVLGRSPYDFWTRNDDGICAHDQMDLCIRRFEEDSAGCADSLTICPGETISPLAGNGYWRYAIAWDEHMVCDSIAYVGPDLEFTWNTGSTQPYTFAETSGWYSCTVTTLNGCWSWTDSVYVTVTELPYPELSTSDGQWEACEYCEQITICDPTVFSTQSVPSGISVQWYASNVPIVGANTTSLQLDSAGAFAVRFTNDFGCYFIHQFIVHVMDSGLPAITNAEFIVMVNGEVNQGDTVATCPGQCVGGELVAIWYAGNSPVLLSHGTTVNVGGGCDGYSVPGDEPLGWSLYPDSSGWYQIDHTIQVSLSPCPSPVYTFPVHDSVYVEIIVPPVIAFNAPLFICPGDTLFMTASCINCDSIAWNESEHLWASAGGDTAWFDAPECYYASPVNQLANELGCPTGAWVCLQGVLSPQLGSLPNVICPGDSAIIFTDMIGTDPSWLGPNGPIASTNDTIWVTEPGDYFFTTVDVHGCELTNGPASIYFAGSPYMDVAPDAILCPGESAVIQVYTNDPTSIAWAPPFTGNDTLHVVTQAGTYSCTLNYCGTTIPLSVTVLQGDPDATVNGSPFTLCTGQEVILYGPPDQLIYFWEPMEEYVQTIVVDQAGDFQLIVFDEYGCSDSSAVLHVDTATVALPLQAEGDTLCSGAFAVLIAQGSGTITWYGDDQASQVLTVNDTLLIIPGASTSYYVVQVDGVCSSDTLAVPVYVLPAAPTIDLLGPDSVCVGDAATLTAQTVSGVDLVWSTPTGPSAGTSLSIDPFTASDAGLYTVLADAAPCGSSSDSLRISAVPPMPIDLGADTVLCNGNSIVLQLPLGYSDQFWNTGSQSSAITIATPGIYSVQANDAQGCAVAASIIISFGECGTAIGNVITPNGDGLNDALVVDGKGSVVTLTIFDRWGLVIDTMRGTKVQWNGTRSNGESVPDGVYFYEVTIDGGAGPDVRKGYVQLVH